MEDRDIIELYFNRDEKAIEETSKKYGDYCFVIANNILRNSEDAKECVNDTYLGIWNSIPPQRPYIFQAFIAKIVRNISFNKWRNNSADKRGGGEAMLSFDELEACIPDGKSVNEEIENRYLADTINRFLGTLDDDERNVFVCRYFYFDSVSDIASRFGFGISKVKMMLKRTRDRLRDVLIEEGITG